MLRIQRTSTTPRIIALVVLGLVRARRGDPERWPPLQAAWELAHGTGELPRLGPVAAARAEVAWLEGDRAGVAAAVADVLPLAVQRDACWLVGQLAEWLQRAGAESTTTVAPSGPFAFGLAGDWAAEAANWSELGRPYEAALALAELEDPAARREALEELHRLGARPAAAIVARRLRHHGASSVPRGPRPTTRKNPENLTARELEVLRLLATGLRDQEIAERLALSTRTVSHHVSAVLGKLGVRSRAEASVRAVQLGDAHVE